MGNILSEDSDVSFTAFYLSYFIQCYSDIGWIVRQVNAIVYAAKFVWIFSTDNVALQFNITPKQIQQLWSLANCFLNSNGNTL